MVRWRTTSTFRPSSASKSWRVRLIPNAGTTVAIIDAVRDEVIEAGPDATISTVRLGVRLKPDDIEAMRQRLTEIADEFNGRDDPEGSAVGFLAVLHKRRV